MDPSHYGAIFVALRAWWRIALAAVR